MIPRAPAPAARRAAGRLAPQNRVMDSANLRLGWVGSHGSAVDPSVLRLGSLGSLGFGSHRS